MVKVVIGDIFESSAQTLVNTVNCVGVMGKGIALEFKNRFPDMYREYVAKCTRHEVRLGRPYLYKGLLPPWILNFPTKDHWRSVTRLADIEQGLRYLIERYREWGIESLAVPPLGCGHGQLEWRIVGPTLYRYLDQMDIQVELYAPYGTPHEELRREFLTLTHEQCGGLMPEPEFVKPAWIALVEALRRIEREPYHWPVGRTIFQKMAYVATREGLPTGLHFEKRSFGPFSSDLKAQITRLANNGLIREERLGKMLAIKVGPTFEDARCAYLDSLNEWSSKIDRIVDLFCRTGTDQAEMMATVMFAASLLESQRKDRPSECDVLQDVKEWKHRHRPPLNDEDIAYAIRSLAILGWLNVTPCSDLPLPEEATAAV